MSTLLEPSLAATPATPRAPAAPTPALRRFAFIDALRGWAFLAVLLFHIAQRVQGMPRLIERLLLQGWAGVQLFFVVSALTLFLSLQQRKPGESRPVRSFFLRRLFRILPMYWCAILLFLCIDGWGPRHWAPDGISWGHVAANACFVHSLHPIALNGVVPGGWSVATEMSFYLLVPLLFALITSLRRALAFFLATAALGSLSFLAYPAVVAVFNLPPTPQRDLAGEFTFYWLPTQMPVFALGFIAVFFVKHALATPAPDTPHHAAARRENAFLLVSAGILIALAMASGVITATWLPPQLVYGAAAVLVTWGLALHPFAVLVNPVTSYLGTISYSAYLLHFAFLGLLPPLKNHLPATFPPLLVYLLALLLLGGLTVAAATVTHRLIESPGIRLGSRLIKRLNAPRNTPAPA